MSDTTESPDDLHFSWKEWPFKHSDDLVIPLACLYTPLKEKQDLSQVRCRPTFCGNCSAILNPLCTIEACLENWVCCICFSKNKLPPNCDPSLNPKHCTFEYILTQQQQPPIFLFVVDTCMDQDELAALKERLKQCISLLPPNAIVGMIIFGHAVKICEFNYNHMTMYDSFSGKKEYSVEKLMQLTDYRKRFLRPVHECEAILQIILNEMINDQLCVASGKRPLRSTGAALSLAVRLLEFSFPNTGARIMLFISGPCSHGPGIIVSNDLKIPIRTQPDIQKDEVTERNLNRAIKYYEKISARAYKNSHAIDIYSCSANQTGLFEMKSCPDMTGGYMIMYDSFASQSFTETLHLVFARNRHEEMKMAFNGVFEVKTSRGLKFQSAIGPCMSTKIKPLKSSKEITGIGSMDQWKFCSICPNTTVAIYFEVDDNDSPPTEFGSIQFVTKYQHSDGTKRLRVTTVTRKWISNIKDIKNSFDQETSVVLEARRLSLFDWEQANIRASDGLLKLYKQFAEYDTSNPNSFAINEYTQYMFFLSRSPIFEHANKSIDQIAYYKHLVSRQNLPNTLIIIQPTLFEYIDHCDGKPTIVPLDSSVIKPDKILLLDTFFEVLIYHGSGIVRRQSEDCYNQPEAKEFAKMLKGGRFPAPQLIQTKYDDSQARILLSKVNPSRTYLDELITSRHEQPDDTVLTDDMSYQEFMEELNVLALE